MAANAAVAGRQIRMSDVARKTGRITVRVSAAQRDLLAEASRTESTTLTDFILDAATSRAENVLADRSRFRLGGEAYAAFVDLLDRPIQDKPRLRERLLAKSVFER